MNNLDALIRVAVLDHAGRIQAWLDDHREALAGHTFRPIDTIEEARGADAVLLHIDRPDPGATLDALTGIAPAYVVTDTPVAPYWLYEHRAIGSLPLSVLTPAWLAHMIKSGIVAEPMVRLFDVMLALNATHEPQQVFAYLAQQAALTFSSTTGGLYFEGNMQPPRSVARFTLDNETAIDPAREHKLVVATTASGEPQALVGDAGGSHAITTPLYFADRLVGVIVISRPGDRTEYTPADRRRLVLFGRLAAGVLQKTWLLSTSRRRASVMESLSQIGMELSAERDTGRLLRHIVTHAATLLRCSTAILCLVTSETGLLHYAVGHNAPSRSIMDTVARGEGIAGRAWELRRPVTVTDFQAWPERTIDELPFRRTLGVPLLQEDEVVGVLVIADNHATDPFTDEEINLASLVAQQAAIAIGKNRLLETTHLRHRELQQLAGLSAALRSINSLDEISRISLQEALQLINGNAGAVFLLEPPAQTPQLRALIPDISPPPTSVAATGIIGHVLQTRELYLAADATTDPFCRAHPEIKALLPDCTSVLVLPLWADDAIVGILFLAHRDRLSIGRDQRRVFDAMSDIVGAAIKHAYVVETLEERVAERNRILAERNSALAAANERLNALDRMKSKFVSDISHQLRTPVTSLALYTDLLTTSEPENHGRYLQVVRQEVGRLTRLVDDILKLARWDLGEIKSERVAVDLNQIVRREMEPAYPVAAAADVALDLQLEADLPLVLGEAKQLGELVAILLDNALTFTPAGRITVRTAANLADNTAALSIEDTGVGIPADELDHIFERMFRGRLAPPDSTSTGLGLTIAQQIACSHRASIDVRSEEGRGSTFVVHLPLAGSQAHQAGDQPGGAGAVA